MKVALTCKMDAAGAYGLIKAVADVDSVTEITVFRDRPALPAKKTTYHSPNKTRRPFLNQFAKLWRMIGVVTPDTRVTIGIYEIPHSLLAYIMNGQKLKWWNLKRQSQLRQNAMLMYQSNSLSLL